MQVTEAKVATIRELIAGAHARDRLDAKLDKFLHQKVRNLHAAIKLPDAEKVDRLNSFVTRYIAQVPDFLEAITEITREAGIYENMRPLLLIAGDYFLAPPDLVKTEMPYEALLEEAYLAHRLLEEINDRFIGQCGIPLAPFDMTRANVLAHEVIGEPFANELDQAVLFSTELLLNNYSFSETGFQHFINLHRNRGWSQELQRWPCLTEDLAIVLNFGGDEPGVAH